MRALAAMLAVAAVLVVPAQASAARLPLPQITQVARDYWPGSVCAGRETILRNVVAEPAIAEGLRDYGARPLGLAWTGTCTVAISPDIDGNPWIFCGVLVHEFGHLAGHAHTDDALDVMAPRFTFPPPACDRFLRGRDRRYLLRVRAAWVQRASSIEAPTAKTSP